MFSSTALVGEKRYNGMILMMNNDDIYLRKLILNDCSQRYPDSLVSNPGSCHGTLAEPKLAG